MSSDAAAIALAEANWLAAYLRGDVPILIGYYVEDAVLLPDGEPEVRGRAAVRAWIERFFARYTVEHSIDNSEIVANGEWGFMRGNWLLTLHPRDGTASRRVLGKHLVLWRREIDGVWRVARDMWNTDGPAEPA